LVAAKVAEIVIMGGDYPKGSGVFNLASDPGGPWSMPRARLLCK
jgi:hypothetical protein